MREASTLSETESISVAASVKKVKMEDRKRPLNDLGEDNQPSKRQAVTAPSTSQQGPGSQEDVVHFQKEAIYRQMQVYKREKDLAESRLEDLVKSSTYHDDHLRIVDAWWEQVIDEVRLLSVESLVKQESLQNGVSTSFPSSLLFADQETFRDHLRKKREYIMKNLTSLFENIRTTKIGASTDEKLNKLETRVGELLATEKVHNVELERLRSQKEDVEQQLTDAAIRYLQAEKKLDRFKSITLAKIEKQATQQPATETKPEAKSTESDTKNRSKTTDSQVADAELARKEAQAIASKQEKELQQLQADNTRLSEQVTKYTIKLGRLQEEDVITCDVYKNVKAKLDDLAIRYNHIEALNNNLLKEAEKLQAERASYRELLEQEQDLAINEINSQLSRNDADLARIRAVRDEAVQENTMRKIATDKHLSAVNEVNELAKARKDRIDSLESEVVRLKLQLNEQTSTPDPEHENLTREELLEKYNQQTRAYKILEEELPALEAAFKKAHDLCSEKIINLQESSAKMDRLVQEKVKADQKYFTAMKAKDTMLQENRLLKNTHQKSSEIISQLKDAEKALASKVANLEKQMAELKNVQHLAAVQAKDYQRRILEGNNTIDSLKKQVAHMTDAIQSKDSLLSAETESRRKAEIELEKTTVRLEGVQHKLETQAREESEDDQVEALRSMVRCTICRYRIKDTVISGCGHVFCKECAEERITSRSRKCPNCGRPFAKSDMISIHL